MAQLLVKAESRSRPVPDMAPHIPPLRGDASHVTKDWYVFIGTYTVREASSRTDVGDRVRGLEAFPKLPVL